MAANGEFGNENVVKFEAVPLMTTWSKNPANETSGTGTAAFSVIVKEDVRLIVLSFALTEAGHVIMGG